MKRSMNLKKNNSSKTLRASLENIAINNPIVVGYQSQKIEEIPWLKDYLNDIAITTYEISNQTDQNQPLQKRLFKRRPLWVTAYLQ